ncbi:MAG: alpha/beta hydrolase, partial [Chloracidobacterium sp.]
HQIATPNGETLKLQADPYGALLLAHTHAAVLFAPSDVEPARAALRSWLWGEPDRARRQAAKLSPAGQRLAQALFDGDYAAATPSLLRQLERRRSALREVSPQDALARIRCPVFLVHGARDAVVPPSETQWLAQGLGGRCRVLISRAVGHVEVNDSATPLEKLEVAQFLNDFLATARAIR